MKKLILIAIAAIAGTQANAQFSINPEAGVNFATMKQKLGPNKVTTGSTTGFKVGAVADIDIAKGFFIQPGLFYTTKGYGDNYLGVKTTVTLNYLEIPLNLGYRYDMGSAGSVFATAGPYMGIGLNGKMKTGSLDSDIKFGTGASEYKKLDYGVNFSVGYISPIGIYVRGQYGLGLANLSNVNNTTTKNNVWSVSLGYAFQLNER